MCVFIIHHENDRSELTLSHWCRGGSRKIAVCTCWGHLSLSCFLLCFFLLTIKIISLIFKTNQLVNQHAHESFRNHIWVYKFTILFHSLKKFKPQYSCQCCSCTVHVCFHQSISDLSICWYIAGSLSSHWPDLIISTSFFNFLKNKLKHPWSVYREIYLNFH